MFPGEMKGHFVRISAVTASSPQEVGAATAKSTLGALSGRPLCFESKNLVLGMRSPSMLIIS